MYALTRKRRFTTTMTNNKTTKSNKTMATLDKIWENIGQEDNGNTPMDMDEEEMNKTVEKSRRTLNLSKQANDDDNNNKATMPTTPLFPMTIRFKITSDDESSARKKHLNVLNAIKQEMEHFELYRTDNNITQIDNIQDDDFKYNPIGKRNKGFIVVHRIIIDTNYYNIKNKNALVQLTLQS